MNTAEPDPAAIRAENERFKAELAEIKTRHERARKTEVARVRKQHERALDAIPGYSKQLAAELKAEHEAGIRRIVNSIETFLFGWTAAAHLKNDANREEVLAALGFYDRERFLEIEQKVLDPLSKEDRNAGSGPYIPGMTRTGQEVQEQPC